MTIPKLLSDNPKALEAAQKAMSAEIQNQLIDGHGEAIDVARAAITAFLEALVSEGKAGVETVESSKSPWPPFDRPDWKRLIIPLGDSK